MLNLPLYDQLAAFQIAAEIASAFSAKETVGTPDGSFDDHPALMEHV